MSWRAVALPLASSSYLALIDCFFWVFQMKSGGRERGKEVGKKV